MTATEDAVDADIATDPVREAIAKAFADELGDGFIAQHITPGRDLCIRVAASSWVEAARFARDKLGMTWIDFISAIDWMPNPYGREMEAEQDWVVHGKEASKPQEMTTGVAGGDTRFQMFMRLYSIEEHTGVTIKADVPDDAPAIETLIPVFVGASWHEREVWEMFGIDIIGHPDKRVLYLPTGFEGNPMRKDFPLVARRVKPWPGIVDVEAMPGDDDAAATDADVTASEDTA
ncbi:MAG: NADH-quinone oxidoreductase subunit C [Acidimicrobiales bacterium]|jgi:NADH-quinone oxidoreductase subunit C